MRVAIVHDWLVGMRGGEHCLEVLCCMFPGADIYTLFHRPERVSKLFKQHKVFVSSLGKLPGVHRYYRHLLPMFGSGVRSLEQQLHAEHAKHNYDLMISISHCVAKNVEPPAGVPHVCYCLTPARYFWDQYDRYFAGKKFEPVIRRIVARLQALDIKRSVGVTEYIGISEFVADRIRRFYGREAAVIYPPVRTDWIRPAAGPGGEADFLCVSALVPYKNVDLIIRAFNELPFRLKVVGTGPEERRLRALANSNIEFIGFVEEGRLAELYRTSRALVFGAEEDFGMVPVEMMAAGRPVIAFSGGGVLETVRADGTNATGVLFEELTVESVKQAVHEFNGRQGQFAVDNCVQQAKLFSENRFVSEFEAVLSRVQTTVLQRVA